MKRIDYCYYVFVEGDDFLDCFSRPSEVETVWGLAIRAEEHGSFKWSDEIFVRPCCVDFLARRLPADRQNIPYTHLNLHGSAFRDFVPKTRQDLESKDALGQVAFVDMIRCIAMNSRTWALFVLAFCDDIESVYILDIEQAIITINKFLYEQFPDLDSGFCIISK